MPEPATDGGLATSVVSISTDRATTFRRIYGDGFDYVWNSLRRLGVGDEALDDAARDVFVDIHGAVDAFDPARPLRPWLFAFALRHVVARGAGLAPSRAAKTRPDVRLVLDALARLALERRAVFITAEIDAWPMSDVASTLGLSVVEARAELLAARDEFAAAVDRIEAERARRA